MSKPDERMHLLYHGPAPRQNDTRCGTGDPKRTTTDESLVTCDLCKSWAHRGYTAPDRVTAAEGGLKPEPKPPSQAQQAARARFAARYSGNPRQASS